MKNFMHQAINEAKKAFKADEIPVGAVIVKDGKIISRAYNKREQTQMATFHAEILAIQKACKKLGSWRLDGCQMYVSLEPCPMCLGAAINARLSAIYYGAEEKTSGDNISQIIASSARLNHKINLVKLEDEQAKKLLSEFFKNKRKKAD